MENTGKLRGYPPIFAVHRGGGDFFTTNDLQKSRHLQKSRVTERHNRGTKRKLKLHPPPQKSRQAPFFAPGATSIFALCPDCGASFLQMTRLLQVTSIKSWSFDFQKYQFGFGWPLLVGPSCALPNWPPPTFMVGYTIHVWFLFTGRCCGKLPGAQVLGHFWKNCKKYGKSTKNCLSNKGARFARPFCRQFLHFC